MGEGARRTRPLPRRHRRRRLRPLRRRRIHLTRRRRPRRLLRVPDQASSRLNRIQLSRANIQLHPTVRRTSAASSVPRLVSYSPKATGAVQYVTVPDYSGQRRVDTSSRAIPIFIRLQKPLSASSTLGSRSGLIDGVQVTDVNVFTLKNYCHFFQLFLFNQR